MNTDNKLMSIFGSIEDPRSHINKLHNLVDILLIEIISVISGAETWKQMVEFTNSKEEFMKKFLILSSGRPSEYIMNRVFFINHRFFKSKCIPKSIINSIC